MLERVEREGTSTRAKGGAFPAPKHQQQAPISTGPRTAIQQQPIHKEQQPAKEIQPNVPLEEFTCCRVICHSGHIPDIPYRDLSQSGGETPTANSLSDLEQLHRRSFLFDRAITNTKTHQIHFACLSRSRTSCSGGRKLEAVAVVEGRRTQDLFLLASKEFVSSTTPAPAAVVRCAPCGSSPLCCPAWRDKNFEGMSQPYAFRCVRYF
ncbi:hypothetical protein F5884DRAFT_752631 [Xylogone sp. PMI_703]|nr:hypothetical protein F5884DRAFT_752631 [Xylogone sp. PMI_703]